MQILKLLVMLSALLQPLTTKVIPKISQLNCFTNQEQLQYALKIAAQSQANLLHREIDLNGKMTVE